MTWPSPWHAPDEVLRGLAVDPRGLDPATAASVEAHLLECGPCRLRVADAAPRAEVERTWREIVDEIDRPRAGALERVLVGLGLQSSTARLVAASAGQAWAWIAAVVVAVATVAVAARAGDAAGTFLVLAPLAPLAAVASTFRVSTEVGGEAAFATPISGLGLLVRRTLAVTVASAAIVAVAGVALPGFDATTAAWLAPAFALSATALAASTRWTIEVSALGVALTWSVTVLVVQSSEGWGPVAQGVLASAGGQAVALLIGLASSAVAVTRRDRLLTLGGS